MPRTKLVLYREKDGSVPLLDWLHHQQVKVIAKCKAKLERLAELGHELRRPEADFLRDGIYELRVGMRGQNYRMLYFFHGQEAVVLTHGCTKEAIVPVREIELAIERREKFLAQPVLHTVLLAQEENQDESDEEEGKNDI